MLNAIQKLELGSNKWHMLDHVAEDIVQNGGPFLCDEGLYGYSNKLIKQYYEITYKRWQRAMDESIEVMRL